MAKQRNHRATLAKRNELARERGFRNYYEQRKVTEKVNKADDFVAKTEVGVSRHAAEDRADYERQLKAARAYHKAFYGTPAQKNDYSRDSGKAYWFVEVLNLMTYEEWAQHYPNGVREYRKLVG